MRYLKLVLFSSVLFSQVCIADTATCIGPVVQLTNQVPDGFFLKLADSGLMKMCNPEVDTFLVTPQNCKHIASLASLAYATGKNLTVTIANSPGPNCADIPDGLGADVSYVGIDPQ